MSAEDDLAKPGADHRPRVAAERRGKMRARLLDTVLDLYQPGKGGSALVIDDVVRAAGVARGTFYKYFETLDQAVAETGEGLAEQMVLDFAAVFESETDASVRAVGGAAMTLLRAQRDPAWAGFTCRVDYVDFFARHSVFDLLVRAALREAKAVGRLHFSSLDAAVDLIIGATVEARRRVMRGVEEPEEYARALLGMVFAGLGMNEGAFDAAYTKARARIEVRARSLPWWAQAEGSDQP